MKQRKIPTRMCVVTREKYPKQELIRVVRTDDGIKVDPTGKLNGRGAYLKKDALVIDKARKIKVLDRVLETEIPDEIFDQLKTMI